MIDEKAMLTTHILLNPRSNHPVGDTYLFVFGISYVKEGIRGISQVILVTRTGSCHRYRFEFFPETF